MIPPGHAVVKGHGVSIEPDMLHTRVMAHHACVNGPSQETHRNVSLLPSGEVRIIGARTQRRVDDVFWWLSANFTHNGRTDL